MRAPMDLETSPLALPFPQMPPIKGVVVRTIRAGYKDWDRADLTYVRLVPGTVAAGVFTKSACASSEVELGRQQIKRGTARALIVNAGNSNAFTGYRGREAVEMIQQRVAQELTCDAAEIFVSSTGVIGVPLPKDVAAAGLDKILIEDGGPWKDTDWQAAANAIGTTDTFPKGAHTSAMIGDKRINIVGIIKGSGMIAPDMATMLGYIFTDADVSAEYLQQRLDFLNPRTFGSITVDSDTSTSDTVLAFATGQADHPRIENEESEGAMAFGGALAQVCRELAELVVRDGEGASKLIEVSVSGAVSDESAKRVAMSIANSPLVKTAIAGGDANWGRIVMAVGKAGEPADRDKLSIAIGGRWVAKDGMPVAEREDEYPGDHEAALSRIMANDKITIVVNLGMSEDYWGGRATVKTCDLTHGYISINADYRS